MLEEWTRRPDRLCRSFEFETFRDCMAFMVKVAQRIEQMDHHPEWRNINRTLYVELTTHSAGAVTPKDEALAAYLSAAYAAWHNAAL
jgi:4a-hydroxytetrahydrobiopterin dehydratase